MFNHVALLYQRVASSGSASMFKIPKVDGSDVPHKWTNITFAEFAADVDAVASFLTAELKAREIPYRSVVSVWVSGFEYAHLVYMVALARSSYVPQLFSQSLTHSGIIFELMEKAGSKAIIHDPSLSALMDGSPFPSIVTLPISTFSSDREGSALPDINSIFTSEDDVCFIYHTSGSTSGSPKLVPFTCKFIKRAAKQSEIWLQGGPFDSQDVFVQVGSFCHTGGLYQYLGSIHTGACFIQPSKMRFTTDELISMVKIGGLNRLTQFSPFFSLHVKAARSDPDILKLLQGVRIVSHGGVNLALEDEEWCVQNGVPLLNMYGNTECAFLMASTLGKPSRFLYPLPDACCRFDPVGEVTQLDNASVQLFELVVGSDFPGLPQAHLLSLDGNFHTGDLFERQSDGSYVFRGRDDDWIKVESAKRCDTKAIEDHIRETCSDLVKDCVVVGNGRPSPALFVEALHSSTSETGLKQTVLKRMEYFNSRRYVHERITDGQLVFVVPEGVLPRTMKGNFRRRAIEETYSKELDAIYTLLDGY